MKARININTVPEYEEGKTVYCVDITMNNEEFKKFHIARQLRKITTTDYMTLGIENQIKRDSNILKRLWIKLKS